MIFFGIPMKYIMLGMVIFAGIILISSIYINNKAIDKGLPIVIGGGVVIDRDW